MIRACLSALGAEGRKFESCLPDQLYHPKPSASANGGSPALPFRGSQWRNMARTGAQCPGIVPERFSSSGHPTPYPAYDFCPCSRRVNSASTASRIRSDIASLSRNEALMRTNVPARNRAVVISPFTALMRGRPIRGEVGATSNVVESLILLLSPIDRIVATYYIGDSNYGGKSDEQTRPARASGEAADPRD